MDYGVGFLHFRAAYGTMGAGILRQRMAFMVAMDGWVGSTAVNLRLHGHGEE